MFNARYKSLFTVLELSDFFTNYAIFLNIFKLSHVASTATKVTKANLWMETMEVRSVVLKNTKI